MLGDMPRIRPGTVDRLLASARERPEGVHLPVHGGRRGHPVLWSPRLASALRGLGGDQGARSLLDAHSDAVVEVAVDDPGVLLDVDTLEALRGLGRSGSETGDGSPEPPPEPPPDSADPPE
jgi:molybdenum cofactor cytidylyltransferase